jgi:hypothetical protein
MENNRRIFLKNTGIAASLSIPTFLGASVLGRGKLHVVIVDTSLTVQSFKPAEEIWPSILKSAERGNRIVLALAMGAVKQGARRLEQREFRLVRDVLLPPFDIWKSQRENRRLLDAAIGDLKPAMAEALRQGRSNRTELLHTLHEVARYCAAAPGAPHECTFISDMLEDSDLAVFAKSPPTEQFARDLIARQRSAHDIPDLRGLRFRAVGVTGPTRTVEERVRKFWYYYLPACGAMIVDYGYQPTTVDLSKDTWQEQGR